MICWLARKVQSTSKLRDKRRMQRGQGVVGLGCRRASTGSAPSPAPGSCRKKSIKHALDCTHPQTTPASLPIKVFERDVHDIHRGRCEGFCHGSTLRGWRRCCSCRCCRTCPLLCAGAAAVVLCHHRTVLGSHGLDVAEVLRLAPRALGTLASAACPPRGPESAAPAPLTMLASRPTVRFLVEPFRS